MESYFPVIKNNCVKEYDSFNILKDYDILNLTINFTVDYEAEDEGLRLQFAYKVGEFLTHYYTPFLVFAGGFGNILSVIVFFRTKLRMLSSSYYLAALGISDTCFLLGAFISWLNYIDISIYNKNYFCQFFTYLCSLCSFLSAWFVVAFTVERFIAVLYPLKRHLCTIKRACTVLFILFIIGCFLNIPTFIYAAPLYSEYLNDSICDVRPENKMKIFNYIDTVIVFVIPFSIIAVLNILTAKAVWKVSGVRRIVTVKKRLLQSHHKSK
ncbi:CLUMA_CG013358, isoform A [Clunio marinus]|uniref:CLUMA_CG013358, isoform A n=1 Tax=Clunio marinus TaxID=568069 RepID=A0A1J1IIM9_9DIPT|nr:CLUMA_CG013358, isoform A [Clunio marinus]